jgi:hypothetical protein
MLGLQGKACFPGLKPCGCYGVTIARDRLKALSLLILYQNQYKHVTQLDGAAAAFARQQNRAAVYLYPVQQSIYTAELQLANLQNAQLTDKVMEKAADGRPEWLAPEKADAVALREAGMGNIINNGAANELNVFNIHSIIAAMGSRGHPFTAGRLLFGPLIARALTKKMNLVLAATFGLPTMPDDELIVFNFGSAYFGTMYFLGVSPLGYAYQPPPALLLPGYHPLFNSEPLPFTKYDSAMADDHGFAIVRFSMPRSGCSRFAPSLPVVSSVRSTSDKDLTDWHAYSPSTDVGTVGAWRPDTFYPKASDHSLPGGWGPTAGVWFDFVDYNWVNLVDKADIYGQPKNYAVVQRDYLRRPEGADPWALHFRFAFTPEGSDVDLRGLKLQDGTDISKQTALSAGVAYYHRPAQQGEQGDDGHFDEPPNLLNPYWRAGLARIDVDRQGRQPEGDVFETLEDVETPWAADAWRSLMNTGYRGFR